MEGSLMDGGPGYNERLCPFVNGECLKNKCKFYLSGYGNDCIFELLSSFLKEWQDGELF
jgi:hypothetical protein